MKYFIRLPSQKQKKDYYIEWSTVVDAPISEPMSYLDLYQSVTRDMELRHSCVCDREYVYKSLVEVTLFGAPIHIIKQYGSVIKFVEYNRAGKSETTLRYDKIIDYYLDQFKTK